MATKLEIIRDEITNDPLSVGYAGMTDQQVTDSLNAFTRTYKELITGSDVLLIAERRNVYAGIVEAANLGDDFAISMTGLWANDPQLTFRTNASWYTDILAGLLAAGVINAPTRNAFRDLGEVTNSRASELDIGRVHVREVTRVRGG